jgi:hypothetical protein
MHPGEYLKRQKNLQEMTNDWAKQPLDNFKETLKVTENQDTPVCVRTIKKTEVSK